MGRIEAHLAELGLELPPRTATPPGFTIPFAWVRTHSGRAFVSGHGALDSTGKPVGPFGKVPTRVSVADARLSARHAALAALSSLEAALGNLDRITAWLTVSGYVNADPGFTQTTTVINGFSDLIIELYGPEAGRHARTAIGVTALPLDMCVVVSAEVVIA